MSTSAKTARVLAVVVLLASAGYADWADSFDGGTFGLQWTFVSFPDVAKTFTQTITGGEGENPYLTFTETTAVSKAGRPFRQASAAARSSRMSGWAPR